MAFTYSGVVLFVADIKRATVFYQDSLGQEILFDHGPCVAFKSGFSLWERDRAAEVALPEGSDTAVLEGHGFELYFEHESIETAEAAVREWGLPFVHPMIEQPWHQRCFRFRDPDGHLIEVAEPMPVVLRRYLDKGLSPEEVASETSMPLEVVQAIAGT